MKNTPCTLIAAFCTSDLGLPMLANMGGGGANYNEGTISKEYLFLILILDKVKLKTSNVNQSRFC